MLTLSEAQWQALRHTEVQNFVGAVCEQFLAHRPVLLQKPGREEVSGRMQAGYSLAAELGLLSTQHIVKFLYLCADAPQLATDRQVRAYLLKPGATPEQRLDDLSAVMKLVLKENG
ncbi:conserved hypothetical protein [Cupriavidus taiwanensis]|uniref:hypothetical protein n=1 Tax=Cupriavidus taiwanensis TaxID=164546 RepID=UPI000E11A1CA|nr:hypothetical protein [Cupriavidus taiwanensis]SOZ23615.1 conserved hypothetical protein [Cupriavidus taiwanensis]SPA12453.1 conserved hypothetical protein [Cupriavidus taiwanensis]SPA28270.1 conserved hypothetical protein [Cupriavidus taiwanensis]